MSRSLAPLPPGAGVALGILLWMSIDEGAVPALGLSGHLPDGIVLDRSLAVLRAALRR